jgi:hypothetical protein
MGAEGLEPSRPYDQQILNLLRLPFRHAPKATSQSIEPIQSMSDFIFYTMITAFLHRKIQKSM